MYTYLSSKYVCYMYNYTCVYIYIYIHIHIHTLVRSTGHRSGRTKEVRPGEHAATNRYPTLSARRPAAYSGPCSKHVRPK